MVRHSRQEKTASARAQGPEGTRHIAGTVGIHRGVKCFAGLSGKGTTMSDWGDSGCLSSSDKLCCWTLMFSKAVITSSKDVYASFLCLELIKTQRDLRFLQGSMFLSLKRTEGQL